MFILERHLLKKSFTNIIHKLGEYVLKGKTL